MKYLMVIEKYLFEEGETEVGSEYYNVYLYDSRTRRSDLIKSRKDWDDLMAKVRHRYAWGVADDSSYDYVVRSYITELLNEDMVNCVTIPENDIFLGTTIITHNTTTFFSYNGKGIRITCGSLTAFYIDEGGIPHLWLDIPEDLCMHISFEEGIFHIEYYKYDEYDQLSGDSGNLEIYKGSVKNYYYFEDIDYSYKYIKRYACKTA